MVRRPPRFTRPDPLFPYTTLFRSRLPFVAAASGMIVPAAFYLLFTAESHGLEKGWAIPAATDIAFAIGVLALLGKRAPTSLKLFLRSEEHTSELQSLMRISYAVFCLKKKKQNY